MIKRISAILVAIIFTLSGCKDMPLNNVEDVIENSERSIVHIFYGDNSCSGFHIGNGVVITAAHCFSDLPGYATENITMDSYLEKYLQVEAIEINHDKDLAILNISNFVMPALLLWDPELDGRLRIGSSAIAMGFPGYYDMQFTFETGYVKDIVTDATGLTIIKGRDLVYPGESGGPLISLKNGKVIGVGHTVYSLMLMGINKPAHKHYDIGTFVSVAELNSILSK